MYVSKCHELEIVTQGDTVEDVLEDTDAMVIDYFEACAVKGILADVLRKLLGTGEKPGTVDISADYEFGRRRLNWKTALALGA